MVTSSRFNLKNCQKGYNLSPEVLPLAVDLKTFSPSPTKPKQFLFIGEPVDINGFDLVKKAESVSTNLPQVKVVSFKNNKLALTDNQLAKLYQESYAVLCLARNEPFGLTALEGMACGVPIIAVDEGGYSETVTANTGILIQRDAQQLVEAMKTISQSESLRKKMGTSGRKRVEKLFTWEKHGLHLDQILKKTISSRT